MGGKNVFLKAFFKNPRQIGAVAQTSSFVADEMTRSINFSKAKCLVEFGSGMGNMTEKILEKMCDHRISLYTAVLGVYHPPPVPSLSKKY